MPGGALSAAISPRNEVQCLRESLLLLFTLVLDKSGRICGAEGTAADWISYSGLVVAWSTAAGAQQGWLLHAEAKAGIMHFIT